VATTFANTNTQFIIDFSNCNCSQPTTVVNTITRFTIDFSNCICSQPGGGSEPFEVKFEQNKKGILVKIKNLTSNILDLVVEAYISAKHRYILKSALVQPNEESLIFFPVNVVSDVIFAIYEKSNECTLIFDEQSKIVTFYTTNQNVAGLCTIYDDNGAYKAILKSSSSLDLYAVDSIVDVHCFCVKKGI